MESFRKVIKGWLGKVLLVLFLTPLALVGIEGYFSGGSKAEGVVQTVNGQDITEKELEAVMKSYKEQYLTAVNGDEAMLNPTVIRQMALDTLAGRALLIQQAKKLGISLSANQIEQMLAQQPSFQENGKFSDKLYEQYLVNAGMTSDMLINNLREDHALKMLSSTVMDYALVSKVDIQQIANLQTEQRTLLLASIKLDDDKKNVSISQKEIADYYQQHPNQFKQVASVDVDYILVTPAQVAGGAAPISEADLQQAYATFVEKQKQNATLEVKHILITTDGRTDAEAAKRANEAYSKIKDGITFAQVAAEYSEDPDSKAKGGVISTYAPGAFTAPFDDAVMALKQGDVSKPVKTQFGYHIIMANASNVEIPSFESEKERLTAEIQKSKSANVYTDTINSLNELVVSNDALDVVAQEVKTAQVKALKGITLATKDPIFSDPNVKAKLFNEDVKNGDRNVSSSIQLANGDTVWVKIRDYHAAGIQKLAEATPRVKAKLIEKKAFEAAKAKIQIMLNDFKTQPATTVVQKHPFAFENVGTFARSQGLKREVERAAFSVPVPKEGMWSVTTTALPNELVVVAVSQVNKANVSQLAPEQLQELTKLYQRLRGQQELDDYTQYLKSQAKIK